LALRGIAFELHGIAFGAAWDSRLVVPDRGLRGIAFDLRGIAVRIYGVR